MTDETPASLETPAGTTVAEAGPEPKAPVGEAEGEGDEKKPEKLHQTVELADIGPCKKHVKVAVERGDIEGRLNEKFSELVVDSTVPGFRPGKAPRKIIERRFHTEVANQVKGEVLLASLEQLAEDYDVAPLSAPNIDPAKIEIPKDGPLVYEFDVEVRPEFPVPNYKGLHLRRPVQTFSDADVDKEMRRILAPSGQLVPKEEGEAEDGDYVIADMTTRFHGAVIGAAKEITLRVDDRLAFKDGVAEKFGEEVRGAKAGETRAVDIVMSDAVALEQLRGQTVQASLEIKDVKRVRLPELTPQFLHHYGVNSEDQFREMIRVLLERRLEYQQRQSARQQVMEQIAAASQWELPRDLLMRQARKTLARRVMEMQEAGMSEDEIRGRRRLLEQDVLRSTELALKEHFVLQKIAEVEKVDVDEDDISDEIDRIADQNNESPRRVRARLEKEDLLDTLAAQLIERKALDLIIQSAEYEDVPVGAAAAKALGTVEEQAVPGEMKDPTAEPPKTEGDGEGGAAASEEPPKTEAASPPGPSS
jgi:trigger factor